MQKESGNLGQEFKFIAKTVFGLEEVLAEELRQLGAQDIEILQRAVAFKGTMEVLYKANYCCRTALSILKPFAEFEASSEKELYDQVYAIKWEHWIDVDSKIFLESTLNSQYFTHSLYIAQKTKDAIVDRFRKMFSKRPSVDMENPDFRINIHIFDNRVTLSMNSSGESLHKRGYRKQVNLAPINEVLAAGLIKLSGWQCDCHFFDPMCGSGTLLIEAAMLANNIPAQYYRNNFGFKKWREFNMAEWKRVKEEADKKIMETEFDYQIWGSDINKRSLEVAQENLVYAKLHKDIELFHNPIDKQVPPEGNCMIITNPPYGERISVKDIDELYETIGNTFKNLYGAGKTAWLITSDFAAMKHIGLRPSRKIALYNGSLECRFLKFEIYEGSKKGKYQIEKQ